MQAEAAGCGRVELRLARLSKGGGAGRSALETEPRTAPSAPAVAMPSRAWTEAPRRAACWPPVATPGSKG